MDKTLPLDLENSCNLGQLSDITYGDISVTTGGPFLPDWSRTAMESVGSGRSSPIRGRTMKEYDQQISSLKKENFNLKLRIFYLEDSIGQKFKEEDIIKTNIELQVQCECYKKEIEEKEKLLDKASSAVNTLSSQFNEKVDLEVEVIKRECEEKVQEADKTVQELQDKYSDVEEKDREIEHLKANLEDRDSEIVQLSDALRKIKEEFTEYRLDSDKQICDLKEQLDGLSTNLNRKDRDVKDALDDAQKEKVHLQKKINEKDAELLDKDEMIGNLEDLLRNKEKTFTETGKQLEDTKTDFASLKRQYEKTKVHLVSAIRAGKERSDKIKELTEELEKKEEELDHAREEIKRDKDRIADLEQNLEKLVRSLGKKEGELENFKDMLRQAQSSLSNGENAVEALQKQLEQERQSWNDEKKKYIAMNGDEDPQQNLSNSHQTFHINIHTPHLATEGTASQNGDVSTHNMDELQKKLLELQAENKRLQNLLAATEQTARAQTQKMKYYQRLLYDNGLLPPTMQRSNSDQNLARGRNFSPKPLNQQNQFSSAERLGPRDRSNSPLPFRKSQVQSRSDKDDINNEHQTVNGPEQDQEKNSFQAFSRLFDLVEKFLADSGREDGNISDTLSRQSSSAEVGQLRSRLTNARCALRSLLASESSFYGRELPDNGYSDVPASLPNNLKPSSSRSSSNASEDNSPRSERRSFRASKGTSQTETSISASSQRPYLDITHMSEIERHRASSNYADVWQNSILKSVNGTSVFKTPGGVDVTNFGVENSVRFSDVNGIIPDYDDTINDYSPAEDDDMDGSVSRNSLLHDRTMDNTINKTLSKSHIAGMSGLDPDETISMPWLDVTNTFSLESDNNLEMLNRLINSNENVGHLEHNTIDKYMNELRQLRQYLEKQLAIIQKLQEQLRSSDIKSKQHLKEKEETILELNERLNVKDEALRQQGESISKLKIELTTKYEDHHESLKETEKKYIVYLEESRSQEKRLVQELAKLEQELELTANELNRDKTELQVCKGTVDEQSRLLLAKDSEIEQLRKDIYKREDVLKHQDQLCKDLELRHETLVIKNKEITSHMEELKLTCDDYRQQIEKQNLLIKDFKEQVDVLRDKLSKSITHRKSLEKEAVTEKLKAEKDQKRIEKHKHNLDLMTTEYRKMKFRFETAKSKLEQMCLKVEELKTAHHISQKLIDVQKLTDDEKSDYINRLLRELRELKRHLFNVMDQNNKITQQMLEMRGGDTTEGSRSSKQGEDDSFKRDISLHIETNISLGQEDAADSFHTPRSSSNNTSREVLGAEVMSHSLPLPDRSHKLISGLLNLSTSSSPSQLYADNTLTQSLPLPGKSRCLEGSSETGHFSVPGPIYKQQVTDECLLYNVNDTPRQLASLTRYKIDSEQRSLFAIGMIDMFEKLKKETQECQITLKGLNCRITERLKKFAAGPASEGEVLETTESIEYSTLKEISFSVDNLRVCVDGQLSMIAGFWTSELPNPNEKGELVNHKLLNEKAALEDELAQLKVMLHRLSSGRFNEDAVCDSLESTLQVFSQARKNLEKSRNK